MVLGTGFLLLVSLILSTAVAAMTGYIVGVVPILKPALLVADTVASATVTSRCCPRDFGDPARRQDRLLHVWSVQC